MLILEHADEITLNGQHGEGGGQILRSSLALCAARGGPPLRVHRIRARRKPPGLRPQHLQAVLALAALCDAELHGAQVDSTSLRFRPRRPVRCGDHRFDIGTAGSTPLLLHALFPALCSAAPADGAARSALQLLGGTHVPHAPSAGYLARVWAAAARRCGFDVEVVMNHPGFYPQGGGEIVATVGTARPQRGVSWLRSEGTPRVRAQVVLARLPRHIGERMLAQVARRLPGFDPAHDGVVVHFERARSTGAALELFINELEHEGVPGGFVALGERGVPSEQVADQAVDALLRHLDSEAPVDPHLADQLAMLLALCPDPAGSRYRTSEVTQHLLTHAELLSALWPVQVRVEGELGQPGEVILEPAAPAGSDWRLPSTSPSKQR